MNNEMVSALRSKVAIAEECGEDWIPVSCRLAKALIDDLTYHQNDASVVLRSRLRAIETAARAVCDVDLDDTPFDAITRLREVLDSGELDDTPTRLIRSVEEEGERVLLDDFYRCPNTGEWVYGWTDERYVLVDTDRLHRLTTIEKVAEVRGLDLYPMDEFNKNYRHHRLGFLGHPTQLHFNSEGLTHMTFPNPPGTQPHLLARYEHTISVDDVAEITADSPGWIEAALTLTEPEHETLAQGFNTLNAPYTEEELSQLLNTFAINEPDEFEEAFIEALTKPVQFLPTNWACQCPCHNGTMACLLHYRPCCGRKGQKPQPTERTTP